MADKTSTRCKTADDSRRKKTGKKHRYHSNFYGQGSYISWYK